MSLAIRSAPKTASPSSSRRTDLLAVKVSENDPAMKVVATAFGFTVSGAASNRGTVASSLQLEFNGKKVSVPLRRNDTGLTVFAKLKAKLPRGYEARVLESLRSNPPQVTIGIAKKAAVSKS